MYVYVYKIAYFQHSYLCKFRVRCIVNVSSTYAWGIRNPSLFLFAARGDRPVSVPRRRRLGPRASLIHPFAASHRWCTTSRTPRLFCVGAVVIYFALPYHFTMKVLMVSPCLVHFTISPVLWLSSIHNYLKSFQIWNENIFEIKCTLPRLLL